MAVNRKALLLGMYYGFELEPRCGQGFRDRVRCEAMEEIGFEVYTLDDKHYEKDCRENRHCQANFSDHRMFKYMEKRWPNIVGKGFGLIILDYFFSPAGWVEFRWTPNFFRNTLPLLAEYDVITEGGLIWLPHVNHVRKMMEEHRAILEQYFMWESVSQPEKNPLYRATDKVFDQLILCPDNMTNQTQIRPLDKSGPFFVLVRVRRSEIARKLTKLDAEPETVTESEKERLLSLIRDIRLSKKKAEPSPSSTGAVSANPNAVPGRTTRSGTVISVYTILEDEARKSKRKQRKAASTSASKAMAGRVFKKRGRHPLSLASFPSAPRTPRKPRPGSTEVAQVTRYGRVSKPVLPPSTSASYGRKNGAAGNRTPQHTANTDTLTTISPSRGKHSERRFTDGVSITGSTLSSGDTDELLAKPLQLSFSRLKK